MGISKSRGDGKRHPEKRVQREKSHGEKKDHRQSREQEMIPVAAPRVGTVRRTVSRRAGRARGLACRGEQCWLCPGARGELATVQGSQQHVGDDAMRPTFSVITVSLSHP